MGRVELNSLFGKLDDKDNCYESYFWTDEYISKKILERHLDPFYQGCSRFHEEIRKSVEFIAKITGVSKFDTVTDLGCGPGLYTSLFCNYTENINGIDISKSSIDYAVKKSIEDGMNIKYTHTDFLTLEELPKSKIVLLIYSIFGSLEKTKQSELLLKINKCLPKDGYFIFDSLSENGIHEHINKKDWIYEEDGFWSSVPHLLLKQTEIFLKERDILNKYVLLQDVGEPKVFLFRDHYFRIEELNDLLSKSGFRVDCFLESLSGKEYSINSKEIAIIARKIADVGIN